LSVSYDIKKSKFEPYAEVEVYNQLDNAMKFDKIRYTVGTDYKVTKDAKLTLFYRYQDYNDVDDISGHILGVGASIEL
jgi:opacity protein-like surface antigen